GQEIDALGLGRPRDRWKKDILERQCHIAAGKSHRRQKPVVIDLPKAGRTILVLGKNAMVLQTKAADLLRALLNVRKGVHAEIIHHVAGVIIHLDALVIDFADDFSTSGSGAGFASMLLDHDS